MSGTTCYLCLRPLNADREGVARVPVLLLLAKMRFAIGCYWGRPDGEPEDASRVREEGIDRLQHKS